MGIKMPERDVFVIVNYDFEYITEEGKQVWMKEGEVLLLLSRTNSDWWQVIINYFIDLIFFVLYHTYIFLTGQSLYIDLNLSYFRC